MLFRDIDFAEIARAMGAEATRIQRLRDLDVLDEWLQSESPGVLLLDVQISTEFVAEYVSEKVAAESGDSQRSPLPALRIRESEPFRHRSAGQFR